MRTNEVRLAEREVIVVAGGGVGIPGRGGERVERFEHATVAPRTAVVHTAAYCQPHYTPICDFVLHDDDGLRGVLSSRLRLCDVTAEVDDVSTRVSR